MKKLILSLSIIALAVTSFSQDDYKTYFENGNVKESVVYKSETDLKVTTFFASGKIKTERYLKEGQRNGTWLAYNEAGNIVGIRQYTDGLKSGNWTVVPENIDNKLVLNYGDEGALLSAESVDPYGNKVASK